MPQRSTLMPLLLALALLPLAGASFADSADVLEAKGQCRRDPKLDTQSICRFAVKIRHTEDGWKHYTRHFQLVQPDGEVLVTRFLKRPQGEEEFMVTMKQVRIPRDIEWVDIRAGDLEHEHGETVRVELKHPPLPEESDETATEK